MTEDSPFHLVLRQICLEADGTCSFELVRPDRAALPAFTAGAHVDVHLPEGLRRSYSIASSPADRYFWRIAVKREPGSRGGSAWFHEQARVGMRLPVSPPRNEFALVEPVTHSVLVAGGIGITPLLSMIERLAATGASWELHYTSRSREQMAFTHRIAELAAASAAPVTCYLTGEGDARMDLEAIVGRAPEGTHFYGCGPVGLMQAYLSATRNWPPSQVHHERFAAAQEPASAGGYVVHLARDGRRLQVPAGKSMLDVLLDAGLDLPYSCTQGVCGTCTLRVLDGVPDHRDACLSSEEQQSGRFVVPCCSGARSTSLQLDL